MLGIDLGGDEHRAVAERTRVVDRGELADDPVVEQLPGAREHLVLVERRCARDRGERPRLEREAALEQVQQAALDVLERPGGALRAAADRAGGDHASHRAASSAWEVMTMSAPARRIEGKASRTAERSSMRPASAAALDIA